MRAVCQRVSEASVVTEGRVAGEIRAGLVVLLGIDREDGPLETRRRDVDRVLAEVVAQDVRDAFAQRMVDALHVIHVHREPLRARELDCEHLRARKRVLDLRCNLPRQLPLLVMCRCHWPCSCHKKWARRPTSRTARNVVFAE